MDTADGIFSGRPKERRLEIMRDSRVGALGVLTLVALLLLKLTFINQLPYKDKLWILVLAPALGRTIMLYAISFFPYARQGPGLGRSFGNKISKWYVVVALFLVLIVSYLLGGPWVLGYIFITVPWMVGLCHYINNLLGGHTGDTYGAICEVSETLFIIMAVIVIKINGVYLG